MKYFFGCGGRPCRPPCNICHNCPPSLPQCYGNVLVAAGTGIDPHEFLSPTLHVPFGDALYSIGDSVAHAGDSHEFVIENDGQYGICYQLSVYNPALVSDIPIEAAVRLMSDASGMLDEVQVTTQFHLLQRCVSAYLSAGEGIYLTVTQPELTETGVNSAAIVIAKLT